MGGVRRWWIENKAQAMARALAVFLTLAAAYPLTVAEDSF